MTGTGSTFKDARATGPIALPVTAKQATEYLKTLAGMPLHKCKDRIRHQYDPSYFIDIVKLERAIECGAIPVSGDVSEVPGSNQWRLVISGGEIRQDDESLLDLKYAASMSAARAHKPLIFISSPNGLSMIDGSHRIARAMIDNRTTLPCVVIQHGDLAPYLVPEREVVA